jgi:phosphoglycolate phosphatase-like HAD superfamily hydrolase
MKPSPYLVRAAVGILDAHPAECAFVGDSTSDMLAGRLAGVPVIGYANQPGKADLLRQAGADTVTTALDEITRRSASHHGASKDGRTGGIDAHSAIAVI